MRNLLRHRMELTRARGLLHVQALQLALDTMPILRHGSIKNTYAFWGRHPAAATDAGRRAAYGVCHLGGGAGHVRKMVANLKRAVDIAWDKSSARQAFQGEVVSAVDHLREAVRGAASSPMRPSSWANCQLNSSDRPTRRKKKIKSQDNSHAKNHSWILAYHPNIDSPSLRSHLVSV